MGGPLTPERRQAVTKAIDKAPDHERIDRPLGHRAVGAVAFRDRLRMRDFIATYGPLLDAIPLDAVGVTWAMADLLQVTTRRAVIEGFRKAVADPQHRPTLSDQRDRIEAAVCLAALHAGEQEKQRLADDLVQLAGLQSEGAEAKVATLEWLGESEASARQVAYGGNNPSAEITRRHHQQGLVTGLGCYVSAVLLIYGGIVAVYLWVNAGVYSAAWVPLGLSTAFAPFVGAMLSPIVVARVPGRYAMLLAMAITIALPAALLLAGWGVLPNPWLVTLVSLTGPLLFVLMAWLSLRRERAQASTPT